MASAYPSGTDPRNTDPRNTDPRVALRESDIRPVVAAPARRMPWWIVAGGIGLAALLLFLVLDARRRTLTAPATRVEANDAYDRAGNPPATLFVPPAPAPAPSFGPSPPADLRAAPAPAIAPRVAAPQRSAPPIPPQNGLSAPVQPPQGLQPEAPRRSGGGGGDTALVFDATQGDAAGASATASATNTSGNTGASATSVRVGSSLIRNRATTVPQGTLIPAVLETALDSTRPGLARALVQSDVRGFDGTQVLITRGSRLIGEYQADLRAGQNRAGVMWTRLVRPDGVTIALGSPATDTLGRGGIRGKVNSHFFERFGSAILQSALDVGVNLATRLGNNNTSVVVGYPLAQGASATQGLITGGSQVQRTLTVRQGTAIMVFVARDLDFTGAAGQ